jgi:FlaA1/EpsC-like NDP-sugar epimerase
MGASKKLMEEVILAYSDKLKITTARFANVAFSNGSLLAGFIERLAKRQPLSSPSDVKRFFVSPSESGEICLAACILGNSGEIFFPKLEESQMVNFADIIPSFLDAFGFAPDFCESEADARHKAADLKGNAYPVYLFASETSGEKLYEEFYTDQEQLDLSRFSSLGVISNAERRSFNELNGIIGKLEHFFGQESDKSDLVALLNTMLSGFRHIETGVNLDQKM